MKNSPAMLTVPRGRPSSQPPGTYLASAASTTRTTSAKTNSSGALHCPSRTPAKMEWGDLIDAIRQDKPYNEVKRGAEASLVTCMGRMAAHTGRVVTWDEMLGHQHEFAPDLDKLTADSPAPLLVVPDGKYPIPQPGIIIDR